MIQHFTHQELDRLIRHDLVEVALTGSGELEARVYDNTAADRRPVEIWRSPFDPARLMYLERRIEKAVIEIGWTAPHSILTHLGYMQAAREAGRWSLVAR
jgi:hypothetical protein